MKALPHDIYVRVSRAAGREHLTSPEDQEREARAFAKSKGLSVGIVLPHDLDESGGTMDRPGMQEGLRRVEAGISGGIIVAYLSRASRDTRQGLDLLDQVTRTGGAVYAPNLPDYTTADGRMQTTIQLAIDTGYRDRKAAEFETAKKNAIERGIPVHSRPAVGYRAREDRRLEPDPAVAPVVAKCSERRATGEGPVALGRSSNGAACQTSQGSTTWTKQAVYGLIRNRVYLGELAYGRDRRFVNADAHEAIVDLATWQAAQHPNGRLAPTPLRGLHYLLTGIIRCAACGYASRARRPAEASGSTAVPAAMPAGFCPAPATVDADAAEEAAVSAFWTMTTTSRPKGSPTTAGDLGRLERALERAERALTEWASPDVQDAIGDIAEYGAGLRERRQRRDQAAEELGRAGSRRPRRRRCWPCRSRRCAVPGSE